MNIANLMSQLGKSSNPMSMMMNILTPNQQNQVNSFKSLSSNEQAEKIAQIANEKGLTKEDLQRIVNMFNGKK